MSGMMGEADAIAAALASVQVPQQSAVNNDSLMEAARDLQAQKAADAAARAEHELTRTAIMSGTDPANSPAAAELDQRLREVQCEMELNAQHMRKTDDDAWWVSVDEYGKLGSRCYIPRQCEWQQPRFLSNPAHIDDKAHQEIQKSTTVLPALSRLKNCVEQEWQQQEAMCIGKAKEDKKYELIELEEKGFLADDAYHETVDKLGEATLLQHQGRCTEARGLCEAMELHGQLCEAQSDMFGAKQSFLKALAIARLHNKRLHPRTSAQTKDMIRLTASIANVDRQVDRRWANAKERARNEAAELRSAKAMGFARGYV